MKLFKTFITCLLFIGFLNLNAQETVPVYSDYLSDNVFLIHPSAAGIGNCNKVRFSARTQWSGVDDAPALQTLNGHAKLGENVGVGLSIFNDKNGYHSQQGFEGVFAYHLKVGSYEGVLNQLSFGLGLLVVSNSLDISDFDGVGDFEGNSSYFNADYSMAYHYKGFFSFFTAKNLLSTTSNFDETKKINLRRYLLTAGYYIETEKGFDIEPSVMMQSIEGTGEKFVDVNLKVYKKLQDAQLWFAFSYRRGFDSPVEQQLQYFTPIVGVNYGNFMVSYTYTKQTGDILFDTGGYNQISLGYNFGCRKPRNMIWRNFY